MSLGIFDSGLGGLTVFKELAAAFPRTDMVYLGDTARVPYGNKSSETIIRFGLECADLLVNEYNVDGLVVACNTISSYALEDIEQAFGLPVRGVIRAGAEAALEATQSGHIGVIGTLATVGSGAYAEMLDNLSNNTVDVIQKACPLFVPLVEEAFITGEIPRMVAKHYMDSLVQTGIDTLILGCTHYPLLKPLIEELYPSLNIVDSSAKLVKQVHILGLDAKEAGKRTVLLTDQTPGFLRLRDMLVGDMQAMIVKLGNH